MQYPRGSEAETRGMDMDMGECRWCNIIDSRRGFERREDASSGIGDACEVLGRRSGGHSGIRVRRCRASAVRGVTLGVPAWGWARDSTLSFRPENGHANRGDGWSLESTHSHDRERADGRRLAQPSDAVSIKGIRSEPGHRQCSQNSRK